MAENLTVDWKGKHVRFMDNGLFHSFAQHVAQEIIAGGGTCDYYTPWQGSFPSSRQTRLGEGWPELTRILDPQRDENKVDLWVFLDLFQADYQFRLRKAGARVWGSGDGEALELERWEFKAWCGRNGIRTPPSELFKGLPALRAYLAERKNKYVKLAHAANRGDMDTKLWKNKFLTEWTFDQLEYDLGAFKYDTEFIAEDKLEDIIELGEDWPAVIDGLWSEWGMYAFEVKGLGTVGIQMPYAKMPQCLRDFNAKLSKVMKADQYRGAFSMEGLYNARREYSATDPCCRLGSPSNELLQEMFTGWAKTIWFGAEGKLVSLLPAKDAKYGIVAMVYSEQSGKNWEPLSYKPALDRWVKLRNPYMLGGKRFAVPQGSPTNVAGVVGTGNLLLSAAKALGEHVHGVDGHQIEIATDAISKMLEIITKANQWGATFTSDPLPTAAELKKAVG
jgi:hypothetical protein